MSKSQKENGVQIPFNDDSFTAKWQEWLQYRKERRLPAYVPTGLKKTFTKLVNDSQNDVNIAMQMIDLAIASNWQGIFPLKQDFNGAANKSNPANSNTPDQRQGTSGSRIQAAKDY